MPQVYEGGVSAAGKKIAIIVSKFNHTVTEKLLDGALQCLQKNGADLNHDVDVFYCPGAYELPQVASYVTEQKKYHAVICLGAVIKGETPHFDYICQECARGIGQVSREKGVPVLFGVLTTLTFEQAMERAGGSVGNKGYDTALGAITMANLYSQISSQ
ncbi:MAG: 6,7-dimethyl-8-ribityllumazine synthase [Bacteroidota bacterium]|nr:6,7-dimethyl-8-ribityllumazine synthase [Bacteroidota bacterium]